MSAMVCGNKRNLFEDQTDPLTSVSPPVPKRFRRCSPSSSSSSPIRLPAPTSGPVDQLLDLFPHIDPQILERALEECGYDLDATTKRLGEIAIGCFVENGGSAVASGSNIDQAPNDLHENRAEWVKAFVNELTSSTNLEDFRARAANALEALEQSISSRAGAEAIKSFEKENTMLKEQMEVFVRENTILKRAVAIQHERQKEYEVKNQELQHLKQLLPQYQEQLRVLEINNYALRMHLRQAEQSNSWPGRFNPDVF